MRGIQQAKLQKLFEDIEAHMLSSKHSNAATASDVGVYRKVAVVGADLLVNPRVVDVSTEKTQCRSYRNGRETRVDRALTVYIKSDDIFKRSTMDFPEKKLSNYTGKWSCVMFAVLDALSDTS